MDPYKYNISFRVEKRPDAQKECPINADITFCGKRIFYPTGCKIKEGQWDLAKKRMKRNNFNASGMSSSEVNARLDKISACVASVFSSLEHDGITPTPQSVREALRKELGEERTSRMTVADCYALLINEREEELEKSPKTAKWTRPTLTKHRTMLRHLNSFKKNIYFEDITIDFLEKFEVFLIGKGLSNNYVSKSMMDIKTFLNWAKKKGYNKSDAYQGYSAQFRDETKNDDTANLFALTDEELDAIASFQTTNKSIERTRLMFLFQCFTGMRYSDVSALRWSNIVNDNIDFVAQKTNQHITIPLIPAHWAILDRFPNETGEDCLIFPHISNQKYNDQLKTVGKLAGMNGDWTRLRQCGNEIISETVPKYTMLSSHVGRRTFATNGMRKGLSPEMIRSITGHTTSKMLQRYIKLDLEAKRKSLAQLDSTTETEQAEKEPSNVYDLAQSKNDEFLIQRMLGIPDKDVYYVMLDEDPVLAVVHLAVVLWNLHGATAAAKFIDRLSKDRYNELMDMLNATRAWKR